MRDGCESIASGVDEEAANLVAHSGSAFCWFAFGALEESGKAPRRWAMWKGRPFEIPLLNFFLLRRSLKEPAEERGEEAGEISRQRR